MNREVTGVIDKLRSKLSGYVYLLSFRYANICINVDPQQLLPVRIDVEGELFDIEKLADAASLSDKQMAVIPRDERQLPDISLAVLKVHPEFSQEIRLLKGTKSVVKGGYSEPDRKMLVFTIPEVDKDRHDAMLELVDTLADQCKVQMDVSKAECEVELAEALVFSDEEDKRVAAGSVKEIEDWATSKYEQLTADKKKEIEDAFTAYVEAGGSSSAPAQSETDVFQKMKLNFE